jgi:hypothetical protein
MGSLWDEDGERRDGLTLRGVLALIFGSTVVAAAALIGMVT